MIQKNEIKKMQTASKMRMQDVCPLDAPVSDESLEEVYARLRRAKEAQNAPLNNQELNQTTESTAQAVSSEKASDLKRGAKQADERNERVVTVRPRARRTLHEEKLPVPFMERPFVKKTVAFWQEYKKELPNNSLLFTPFLPLAICALLILFRIFYGIASPSGANIYTAVAAIYLTVFVPPCTIYLRKRPLLSARMGWKLPAPDKLPLILLSAITLFFGAAAFTSIGAYFGITEVRYHLYNFYAIPAATSIAGVLFSTVTLAIIPAIMEEILCRGIIFAEYQYYNTPLALVMSAMFTVVLQFDPSRIIVAFFCGLLLGTVRFVTGSLTASIILHCLYNLACLFYEHFFGIMGDQLSEFLILFFLCAVFALVSLFFLLNTMEKICRTYADERKEITVDLRHSSGIALKDSLRIAFISPTLYFVLLFYLIASIFI